MRGLELIACVPNSTNDQTTSELQRLPLGFSEQQQHVGESNSSTITTEAAHSSPSSNVDVSAEAEAENCDLGGRTIRVAVSSQPPLVDCRQDFSGDWNCNGSNIEVIKVLQHKLNFKVEWLVVQSTTNSQQQQQSKDARSSGNLTFGTSGFVLSLVESGRAWLSGNGFMSIINGRDNGRLKISKPFDVFRMHFLLSKSVRDHDHIFVKPFNSDAWIAILGSALLIVPAFYVINKTSCYYHMRDVRYLRHITWRQCLRFKVVKLIRSLICCVCSGSGSGCCLSGRGRDEDDIFFPDEREMIESVVARTNPLHRIEPKLVIMRADEQRRRKLLRKQLVQERRRSLRLGRRSRRSGFFRVAYVAWYVVGSLAAQGGETEDLPEANSTRILVAFWWLYLIVVVSIHSGILTAILTFPKQNDFIQTLDDFLALEQSGAGGGGGSGMHLTIDRYSEIANLLADPASSHRSPLQQLVEPLAGERQRRRPLVSIVEVDLSRHRERVLDEVERGRAAYLEEKSAINLIITQEYFDQEAPKCQFKSSRFPVDTIPMSLALSRRRFSRRCLEEIDSIVGKIMQTGLAQKWRRKFDAQGNDCLETVIINAGDVDKIELKHVELAFWLLAAGLVLGSGILAAEVIWLFTSELDGGGGGGEEEEEEGEGENVQESVLETTSDSQSDSDSSSSSAAAASDDVGQLRLGHRIGLLAQRSLRSLKLDRPRRSMLNGAAKIKIDQRIAALDQDEDNSCGFQVEIVEPTVKIGRGDVDPAAPPLKLRDAREERRRRRLERAAQRRVKRLRRTIGLVKRLHEGRLYADWLPKVSAGRRIQRGARRASRAIAGHFGGLALPAAAVAPAGSSRHHELTTTTNQGPPVRRRRQNNRLSSSSNSNSNSNSRLVRVGPAARERRTQQLAEHSLGHLVGG